MKSLAVVLVLGAAIAGAQGQYKAPSQYFRKDFPAPNKAGQQQPPPPQQHKAVGTPQAAPEKPVQPKFKDVGTNAQFYFLTDTNRAYPWMKISASGATNMKTGIRQTLSPEMPVQK
jgi:hypothetical protein